MRIKLTKIDELKPGQGKAFDVQGLRIALFRAQETYYAVENSCSHMGAPLTQGFLSGKSITCEWHGAAFNLESGEPECGPARGAIKTYPVFINGSDVEIEINEELPN